MKKTMAFIRWSILLMVCFWWISGCTGRPYLIVDYRLPPAARQLTGQAVRLEIKDLREDPYIFTPRAKIEFRDFKERYSLAWIKEDNSRDLAGEHDLKGLFAEAFKKRLQMHGVEVVPPERMETPIFEVELKAFKIDLQKHKWLANVSYVVNLSSDGQWIAHQKVVGSAERVKIIGRKGADTVLSEIFTEILNRLDIVHLFEQAKLAAI
jgi:hypothetical protein